MQGPSGISGPPTLSLDALRGRDDPQAVKAVAKEMEALFAYELIKAMRETTQLSAKSGLGLDTYMSMFDQELSKLFAERGLGLQDMLTKALEGAKKKADEEHEGPPPQATDTGGRALTKAGRGPAPPIKISSIVPDDAGGRISSEYGLRPDPFTGEEKFHKGLDLPAPEGADIHPVKAGTVLFSGERKGYGNVVVIDHGDGFQSTYAHTSKNLVKEGDRVDTSTVIAQVGSTGRSTGPHVHFEVNFRGQKVNPHTLLAQR